jgi:flagellar motility protein MotE (MotC chaperone)
MLAAPWFLAVVAFVVNAVSTFLMLKPEIEKAKQVAIVTSEEKVVEEKKVEEERIAALPPPPPWNFKTEAVDELVNELKASKEGLLDEMKDLSLLQTQISAEREEVEKLKAEVIRLRQELDARVVEVQEFEKDNLKKLVSTYAAMPPISAVPILKELDEDTVVKIFAQMKPDIVSKMLGTMASLVDKNERLSEDSPARRAARISDKLRLMKTVKKEVVQ